MNNQFERALWESQDIQRQHMQDVSRYDNLSELNKMDIARDFQQSAQNVGSIVGDVCSAILGI